MQAVRSYYATCFRCDGVQRWLVWYSDEPDGVLLSSPERLALFADLAELDRYASERGVKLESEVPAFYDFDRLADWLSRPTREPDCRFLLDAWNLLADITCSLGTSLSEPSAANDVYDKLFWGCNLQSVTPPGEHFEPTWSKHEISTLTKVLSSGLALLRSVVAHAA